MKRINPHRLWTGVFVPLWLLQRDEIGAPAKLLYARLCFYAGDNGYCYPKQDTLAADLGIKSRQVRNLLNELEAVGLIETHRTGKTAANRYYFLAHAWMRTEVDGSDRQDIADHPDESDRQEIAAVTGNKLPVHRKRTIENTLSSDPVPKQQRRHQLPDDWQPSARDIELLSVRRPDLLPCLDTVIENFTDYHKARGTTMLDWSRAFHTWFKRERQSNGRPTRRVFDEHTSFENKRRLAEAAADTRTSL